MQLRQARHQPRRDLGIKIIEQIPGQHSVKTSFRVLQRVLEEFIGQRGGRNPLGFGADRRFAKTLFLRAEKILPGPQQIFRRNSIALVHKEADRGLPDGSEIENAALGNVADQPQEFFQAIGNSDD